MSSFKAHNDHIDFSGIFIKEYPKEEKWYKKLQQKLNKYKRKSEIKSRTIKTDVMHPRDYQYIVNNFIALYNQSEDDKMRLVRGGKMIKKIINGKIVDYQAHFFVDFPKRKSYHSYEISIHLQRDATRNNSYNFESSIINAKLNGAIGTSDISYGVPNDINNNTNVRFYKDTNKYGNYRFMFNDKQTQAILKKQSGKISKINETDKTGVKTVPVGTKRNIFSNRYQRGEPPKQPQYVPEKIYTKPSKMEGKLQIGDKCFGTHPSFDKLSHVDCDSKNAIKFKYEDGKLKHKDKCLSFHHDGNMEFLKCNNPSSCKPNSELNNCMKYKFVKYGGVEIDGNSSCLSPSGITWKGEKCDGSPRADLI